jgi:hypothetical protein
MKENVWNLLLLVEEFMFNHQDLKDDVLAELKFIGLEPNVTVGKLYFLSNQKRVI